VIPFFWTAIQATWYDNELHKVVPPSAVNGSFQRFEHITGANVLSNEAVNLLSVVALTVAAGFSAKLFL
jgi:hypothetical protein